LDKARHLVAASARTGKRLFRSDVTVTKETQFDWDPITDELSFTSREAFFRVCAEDGTVTEVAEAE
ncbi:MAG: hypothetical protein IIA44_08570, partial [Acidobacteria bacterium]|nr:hypothetical protein [Acidobacteriota bacterium]